ncbi:MAG: DUF535 family protein [Desulfuromonadales bacterium]
MNQIITQKALFQKAMHLNFKLLEQLKMILALPYMCVKAGLKAWKTSDHFYRFHLQNSGYWLLKKNIRWAFLAAINPYLTLKWIEFLETPESLPFAENYPYLALKPLQAYMSTQWNNSKRIKVMSDTYRFIQLRKGIFEDALFKPDGCVLAELTNINVQLVLGYHHTKRKEGELEAYLRDGTSKNMIASMAFSLECLSDDKWALYIGCIMGGQSDDVRIVQKTMHGLRPIALMVFVAQELALTIGASFLYGVGHSSQAHRRRHAIYLHSEHDLKTNYDTLWNCVGGFSTQDGWFQIPLVSQRRSSEEIKTNKRSMYRRRYELMDELSRQIRYAL